MKIYGIRLANAIGYVLLDGNRHKEEDIVDRVRHFIQPEKAVRQYVHYRSMARVNGNEKLRIKKNKTADRQILSRRKELPVAENIKVDDAVRFVVCRSLIQMRSTRKGLISSNADGFVLTDKGRDEWVRNKVVADGIAKVVKLNLLLKGRLP